MNRIPPRVASHRRTALPFAVLALAALAACNDEGLADPGELPPDFPELDLVQVASGLVDPVFLTAPAGDARLFIVEQPGRIRIVKNGALLPTPFLDITGPVQSGGEQGLLGMAFHTNYAQNGRFYVSYTGAGGHSVIERYTASGNADVASPASGSLVLGVNQPNANHNGGQISFGPDGYLYVALGDGGGAGDPGENGQNRMTLLGSLLRLDLDGAAPYSIPPGNPFANGAQGRPEIWAYGLRNPWRFAHDPPSGLLYIADVGQGEREEVNVVSEDAAAVNYGWNIMEGESCYASASCNQAGLTLPKLAYSHGSGSGRGCSVTGGYVYRGAEIPGLVGWYLYADYCGGWVRALRYENGAVEDDGEVVPPGLGGITSFGVDGAGEVYLLVQDGRVLRFEAASGNGP
ncbi:MAG: PQQ-dependent sugar dehydrogenase [Gemmatimonadota bacterium]